MCKYVVNNKWIKSNVMLGGMEQLKNVEKQWKRITGKSILRKKQYEKQQEKVLCNV